jgi:pilus assembly protein CpaF
MTTTHANSAREAIKRVQSLCTMAGLDLSTQAIREQIASSVHVIVQQTRFSDGTRKVTSITEVGEIDDDGELILHDIFSFHRVGTGPGGQVLGEHRSTGYVPSFLDEFIGQGLVRGGMYL